jgi:hypothetical protein
MTNGIKPQRSQRTHEIKLCGLKWSARRSFRAAGLQEGGRCGGSGDKAADLIACYGLLPLHDEIE